MTTIIRVVMMIKFVEVEAAVENNAGWLVGWSIEWRMEKSTTTTTKVKGRHGSHHTHVIRDDVT
ncbi:hypothetical protein DERF_012840 [Dermatophagoides farinae]|uniref:Uncharacterized protein n=1 Tax=Dermatophagoides farinae TaxID=6954 RepID=A0A922HT01_DERFA|nr:hypothetical protein DERF_012840 [Dermatophagoides farinae]